MNLEATDFRRWQAVAPPPRLSAEATKAALSAPTNPIRANFLTAEGQAATPLEQEALLGVNDLVEVSFLDRCLDVMRCVGRLRFQVPGGRGYATGFLIAPGLLLTNHHVFPDAGSARGASVEFDYRRDIAGQLPKVTDEYDLDPDSFHVSDAQLDFAVVAVSARSTAGRDLASRGYLRLIPETGKVKVAEFVTIIQHPDGDAMQIALRENQIDRADPADDFLWYHADTAHGSSGSPVFNDSLQVVALHASGHIKRDAAGLFVLAKGGSVASLDGLGESDVVWDANVGFRISRICASLSGLAATRSPGHAAKLEAAMRGGDVLSLAVEQAKAGLPQQESKIEGDRMPNRQDFNTPGLAVGTTVAPGAGLVIPLQLRITLEMAGAAPVLPPTSIAALAAGWRPKPSRCRFP